MMFGRVDIAHPEQDRENRHQDRDVKRGILGKIGRTVAHDLLADLADQHIK